MISFINILSIFNLITLGLVIGVRKFNTQANRVLGLSIIFSATDFIINFLSYQKILVDVRYIVFFNFSFLWCPFVLWYVLLMLKIKLRFRLVHLLHLLPQLLSWSYWFYVFNQGDAYVQKLFEDRSNTIYSWQMETLLLIILVQSISYLSYDIFLIFRLKSSDNDPLFELRKAWMKQFILILTFLILLTTISYFILPPVTVDYLVAPILYDISNLFLVYKSFGSSGIFGHVNYHTKVAEETTTINRERYIGSTLKNDQLVYYKEKVLAYFRFHEPYTNPGLTLPDLALLTEIPQHHLSQVINQELGGNFFDLVNTYRIEKSKSLMQDPATANLTLEAIGLKSGFGSASAFYRSFKKYTGITPKAYLKKLDVSIVQ